jgi:hypothetical protein
MKHGLQRSLGKNSEDGVVQIVFLWRAVRKNYFTVCTLISGRCEFERETDTCVIKSGKKVAFFR